MRKTLLILLTLAVPAGAAELRSINVDRVDGRYVLRSEVWFGAAAEAVYAVFLNYDLSTQFSAAIVESRNLEPDEHGRSRFYIRNAGCVMSFCRSFERYGVVEHDPPRIIQATVDPEVSDFEVSNETWAFHPEGEGTVVIYDLEFEPKFWVPPVIGPYIIQRKMRLRGGEAIDRIEAMALAGVR